jgi:hypothetical protein
MIPGGMSLAKSGSDIKSARDAEALEKAARDLDIPASALGATAGREGMSGAASGYTGDSVSRDEGQGVMRGRAEGSALGNRGGKPNK